MKFSLTTGRKLYAYGAVVAAMAYGALTLNSQPAYAATCTPTQCQEDKTICAEICLGSFHDQVLRFTCPYPPPAGDEYFCQCENLISFTHTCP
jgi:hypothetical protein